MTTQTTSRPARTEDRRVSKTFKVADAIVGAISACFTNWLLADLITELLG